MKEEILSIASDLREGSMTTKEAEKQLLLLFGVSESTVIHECRRCEFDNKLGFCPRCDTQAYSH